MWKVFHEFAHLCEEEAKSIYIPNMPYRAVFKANFGKDETLTLMGNVPSGASEFTVNCINNKTKYIHLHVKPCFHIGKVIRNYKTEDWAPYHDDNTPKFVFESGKAFTMEIKNEGDAYGVYCSGEKLFSFKQHLPFNQIDVIEVSGDVTLTMIKF
ncbi:32 kDa beta-galactoside-binding lectin-like isoform X2 [Dendropsophus ebraccatus]